MKVERGMFFCGNCGQVKAEDVRYEEKPVDECWCRCNEWIFEPTGEESTSQPYDFATHNCLECGEFYYCPNATGEEKCQMCECQEPLYKLTGIIDEEEGVIAVPMPSHLDRNEVTRKTGDAFRKQTNE